MATRLTNSAVSPTVASEPLPAEVNIAAHSWDALVIGAGPAGSVCAHALSAAGHRVLLVDRAAFPRTKVCGCCIAPGGVQALTDAGLAHVLAGASALDHCHLRIGSRTISLPASGFRVIGRDTLDLRLALAAQSAGATLVTRQLATVLPEGSARLRSTGHHSEEPPTITIRPRIIIAADGLAGSSLADLPEFAWRVCPRSRIGVGATLTRAPLPLPAERLIMIAHPAGLGYLGLVRLPDGNIDAAAALDPVAVRDSGGPAALIARIIEHAGGDPAALRDADWRGTPTLTRRRSTIEHAHVFALGDAAAYVEPFTGEGMTWAFRAGLLLASIIHTRLTDPLAASARPGRWTRVHARTIARHHRRCGVVAHLVRSPRLLRAAAFVADIVPSAARPLAALLGPNGPRALRTQPPLHARQESPTP